MEFEYLDEFIDKLIDKCLIYRKNQYRANDGTIEKNIKLSEIERYGFEDEELEYIMNYLKERDIYVLGSSPAVYTVFDNYRYIRKESVPRTSVELPEEEQIELIKKYQETNNLKYRNKLAESYIRMVNCYALKYVDLTGIDLDELASYGYEGLLFAIDNMDLSKNVCSSYIANSIEKYLLNGIAKEQGFKNDRFHLEYVAGKKKVMERHDGDGISEYDLLDEILAETFVNRKDSEFSRRAAKNRFFVNYATSLDSQEIIDESNVEFDVIEKVFQEQLKENTEAVLSNLTPRQKEIVKLRFGFNGKEPMTLEKIANKIGISANGVDLAVRAAKKKIKSKYSIYKDLEQLNEDNFKR